MPKTKRTIPLARRRAASGMTYALMLGLVSIAALSVLDRTGIALNDLFAQVGTAIATGARGGPPAPEHALDLELSAAVDEPDTGSTAVPARVTRSGPTDDPLLVTWRISAGSADAGDLAGGLLPSGQTTIPAGQGGTDLPAIDILGDLDFEPDETLRWEVEAADGSLRAATATVTIRNDDCNTTTVTLGHQPQSQAVPVPAFCTGARIQAIGAGGGASEAFDRDGDPELEGLGGDGAILRATVTGIAGMTLSVDVGEAGSGGGQSAAEFAAGRPALAPGGWPDGGNSGEQFVVDTCLADYWNWSGEPYAGPDDFGVPHTLAGGGGGGSTTVSLGGSPILIAGGGGGAGHQSDGGDAGQDGETTPTINLSGFGAGGASAGGGNGSDVGMSGNQPTACPGSNRSSTQAGASGSGSQGGSGGSAHINGGGGGGGGYAGGGGGGGANSLSGAGGGGSSHVAPAATSVAAGSRPGSAGLGATTAFTTGNDGAVVIEFFEDPSQLP